MRAGVTSAKPVVRHLNMMTNRTIESLTDVTEGVRELSAQCPLMRKAHEVTGDPPLRRSEPGFAGLARIVVGQQLSTSSANAIWGRIERSICPLTPRAFLDCPASELRSAGLSATKVRTLGGIADACLSGSLDLAALNQADDGEIHQVLCALKGIGPWTADIYIMFCLGRADSFAAGDLALQVGAALLQIGEGRLSAQELGHLAESWRPWRAVAARVLWAYYGAIKKANAGVPV